MEKHPRTERLEVLPKLTDEQVVLFNRMEGVITNVLMVFSPDYVSGSFYSLGERVVDYYHALVKRFFKDDERQDLNIQLMKDMGFVIEAYESRGCSYNDDADEEEEENVYNEIFDPFVKKMIDDGDAETASDALCWYAGVVTVSHPLLGTVISPEDLCGYRFCENGWGHAPDIAPGDVGSYRTSEHSISFLIPIPQEYMDGYGYYGFNENDILFWSGLLFSVEGLKKIFLDLEKYGFFEDLPEVKEKAAPKKGRKKKVA